MYEYQKTFFRFEIHRNRNLSNAVFILTIPQNEIMHFPFFTLEKFVKELRNVPDSV